MPGKAGSTLGQAGMNVKNTGNSWVAVTQPRVRGLTVLPTPLTRGEGVAVYRRTQTPLAFLGPSILNLKVRLNYSTVCPRSTDAHKTGSSLHVWGVQPCH